MKKRGLLAFFFVLFGICMYIILFVGLTKEKGTGDTIVIPFTFDGYKYFKKGLDIAGGIRLTYKIDLSKYKQVYTDPNEFMTMKKKVEEIILQNIDIRISKLGVSDYNSYIQTLNEEDFIIVEIGGLKDKEEAKRLIGKTVELEFKLPFEKSDLSNTNHDRQLIAEDILKQTVNSPELFSQISSGRVISEDIYYNQYINIPSYQLPSIYKDNLSYINELEDGSVYSKLLSGQYDIGNLIQNLTGEELGYLGSLYEYNLPPSLEGWSVIKLISKQEQIAEVVAEEKINYLANKYNLNIETVFEKTISDMDPGSYVFIDSDTKLKYYANNYFSGLQAFDMQIYKLDKPSYLGESAENIEKLKLELETNIDNIKQSLLSGQIVAVTGAQFVYDGWIDLESIKNEITNFNPQLSGQVVIVDEATASYIVNIKDRKNPLDVLSKFVYLNGLSGLKEQLEAELNKEFVYSFEDVFIQKNPNWIIAKDPISGEILNGAYFKFANVSQGETGQPVVVVNFDDKGKTIFCNLTEKNVGKSMAIFVGGKLVTSPTIQEKICGGSASISGQFDFDSARDLAKDLNEGALPAKLILANEEKISPFLGESAMKGAIIAGLVGLSLIFLLMISFYGIRMGLVSILSLIIFLSVLFAFVKIIGYALSLSGIAAIILSIGMGVDANILIFERIKEEWKEGKTKGNGIRDGFQRSLSAIRDGNVTTGFIGLLLLMIATNVFKGFGTMMLINIILTLLIIINSTKVLLLLFYSEE